MDWGPERPGPGGKVVRDIEGDEVLLLAGVFSLRDFLGLFCYGALANPETDSLAHPIGASPKCF